jgi:RND family efflux transporter MFP subunit
MHNLTTELATLRIDRIADGRRCWRRPRIGLVLVMPAVFALYLISQWLAPREIRTIHPTVQNLSAAAEGISVLTASGYPVARRKAVVSAKIQGRLAELRVEEGSRVKEEGQVIARPDNADYEAQVEVARPQLERAEVDLAEQQRESRLAQSLAQTGVVSLDQLDSTLSRVRLAGAALSQSKANLPLSLASLQNTFIRAPFSGVVVKKMAEVGESVAPIPPGINLSTSSGAIVAITNMATLGAEVDVSESNVARLEQGQPAEVSAEAFPDRVYRARLRQVIPTADRTKATVTVKVALLNPDTSLKPEMSVKVTFFQQLKGGPPPSVRTAPIMRVPKDAFASRNASTVVFEVSADQTVHVVPVVTGVEYQEDVVIKQGLTGRETLVAHPPNGLTDGEHVRLKS